MPYLPPSCARAAYSTSMKLDDFDFHDILCRTFSLVFLDGGEGGTPPRQQYTFQTMIFIFLMQRVNFQLFISYLLHLSN